MSLTPGVRLGVYEVRSLLGVGGMGEVYLAHDTTLGRNVALKILPDAFALDPDRIARFKREAQLLASLNHPNIAAIYGLEQGRVGFLILELVEGPTLADAIADQASGSGLLATGQPHGDAADSPEPTAQSLKPGARSPKPARPRTQGLPLKEALPIARQIADALEAAHEQGIIHRDLKPANIKLRPDGLVKVLDFGLAKMLDSGTGGPAGAGGQGAPGWAGALTNSPTLTSPAMMTGAGMILGTAAYMSPEQAKGRAADKRCDVWAFGCVLYEMLTGKRAFEGEDVSDTLAAVLRAEPDWTVLPANIPPAVRSLLQRCLAKDRHQRVAGISAAQFVLAEPTSLGPTPLAPAVAATPPPSKPFWKSALPVAIAVLVTTALVGAVAWGLRPSPPALPVARFSFTLGENQVYPSVRVGSGLAISPDGTQLAYWANNRVYLRSLAEFDAHAISGSETSSADSVAPNSSSVVFSPDGRSIAFNGDGGLKRVAVSGGAAVTICPAGAADALTWDPTGIVFSQIFRGIFRCSPDGGMPEQLATIKDDEQVRGAQLIPDGSTLLFAIAKAADGVARFDKAQIVAQTLKSGTRKTVINGGSDPRYLPTGHLLYALGGIVFAVPFDPIRQEVRGSPVPVVEGVLRAGGSSGAVHLSTSRTGTLIYVPGPATAAGLSLAVADRAGVSTRLSVPSGPYGYVRASRDGTRLAVGSDDGKEAIVWIYELAGNSAIRRLTIGGHNRFPVWSPDGQRVAFQSNREGDLGIFWQRADGTGSVDRLTRPTQGDAHIPESLSPDGKHLLFSVAKGSTYALWRLSLDDKKATPYGSVQSVEPIGAVFSPDGRWIAYASSPVVSAATSPNRGVFVQPFPATGAIYQVPQQGLDFHPAWTPKGRELVFVARTVSGQFASVTITTQPVVTFGTPVRLPARVTGNKLSGETRAYDILPDGRFVGVVSAAEPESSPAGGVQQIRVVVNWFEELKARVPTK